jgi:hypothetical protein
MSEAPEQVLKRFFAAMRQWEKDCAAHDRRADRGAISYDQARAECVAALKAVFAQFCTTWEDPRRVRGGFHYATPPSYNPDGEQILSVERRGGRVVIHTQETTTGYNNHCVYTLVETEDGWRIVDNRKSINPAGKKVAWDL